ncbi:MAG: HD domain-containing protein [Patescibacteria group bacterium]
MKTNKFSWRSSLAEIKSYSTLGEFQKRYYNIEMRKDGNKTGLVIPGEIANVARTLEKKGFEAYLIGGCVRDLLLGRKPKDWDITTNATPEEIVASFSNTFYENEYGTVGVVIETDDETLRVIEVTPYRLEGIYSDKRRPDAVTWSTKLEDDLKRRDFTINAIACTLSGDIVDLFDGQTDLKKKTVRTVGEPEARFDEDALRMLRAVRIAVELDFTIDPATQDAIASNAKHLKEMAAERIRDEFVRIIMSPKPHIGLILSHKLGLLKFITSELEEGVGVAQNKAHSFDVFEHMLRTIEHAAKKEFPLETRLAALFHDIGKPRTRRWSDEKKDWTFYGHDVVGAKMAAGIMARLAFPNKTAETVAKLVRWHMFFSDTEQITLSAVRRMVSRVGKEHIWNLMDVRTCDRIGTGRPKESPYRLRKYHSMIDEVMRDPLSVSMLNINGGRIMELTKIAPGPKIGYMLHTLLEEVLDDPKRNTAEYLEKRVLELYTLPEAELQEKGKQAKQSKEREEEKTLQEIRKRHWVK